LEFGIEMQQYIEILAYCNISAAIQYNAANLEYRVDILQIAIVHANDNLSAKLIKLN